MRCPRRDAQDVLEHNPDFSAVGDLARPFISLRCRLLARLKNPGKRFRILFGRCVHSG